METNPSGDSFSSVQQDAQGNYAEVRAAADADGERNAVNGIRDQDVLVRWSRRSQPAADVDSSKKCDGVSVNV